MNYYMGNENKEFHHKDKFRDSQEIFKNLFETEKNIKKRGIL